ncbi:MAG: hypothetical protein R3B06_23335 [Kofleriaceae bacterium]
MRSSLPVVVALGLTTSACYVTVRGQATTGADRLETTVGLELIAPRPPHVFVTNFSDHDVMAGYGRTTPVADVLVVPYVGGVWRHADVAGANASALGLEAGAAVPLHHFLLTTGVQATTGDADLLAAFVGGGVDLIGLLCPPCGTTE